ncbi:hypothetical protein [Fervidibacter sacchari]
MAQKGRKGTEWEILAAKGLFVLIGAILGALFGLVLIWSLPSLDPFNPQWVGLLKRSVEIIAMLFGLVIGAVAGWWWASRDIWRS